MIDDAVVAVVGKEEEKGITNTQSYILDYIRERERETKRQQQQHHHHRHHHQPSAAAGPSMCM